MIIIKQMKAKWIYTNTFKSGKNLKYGREAVVFIRDFCIKKVLVKANISISSFGIYKGYINGKEIDNDLLLPGWTDYKKRIEYYKFDITDKISASNRIAVIVGDGWFCGNIAWFKRNNYGEYPLKLWCEIEFEYEDGSRETIVSDKTWYAKRTYIKYNDILNGEYDDFTEYENYSDRALHLNNLEKCYEAEGIIPDKAVSEKTVRSEILYPERIKNLSDGALYDMGQNFAGIIKMRITGERGTVVRVRYGEMTENRYIYVKNLRSIDATDYIKLSGKVDEFCPCFTYHGFRYVEVTASDPFEIVEITGVAVHNDLKRTGFFECDNAILNKFYENTLWSNRSNFVSIPTDCPQRDERLGWTGDAQIFCETAMFNYDCKDFFAKYLRDIRDSQSENGMIDSVAPNPVKDFDNVKGAPAWGDAITVIPYAHYGFYADKQILKDNLPAAKKWVEYCLSLSDGYIGEGRGYGDWLSINEETDRQYLATVYFAYSAFLVSKMCRELCDSEEEKYYSLYKSIKNSFEKKYLSCDRFTVDTQTAYLLAYNFGLCDKDFAKANLVRLLKGNGEKLSCGFVGIKYLLPTLCELGEWDRAYRLASSKEFPGWGYMVVNGATTVWERWDSYVKGKGFNYEGMNSFNHYSLGSCVQWYYKYVLGINLEEGKKSVVLKPFFDFTGNVNRASGKYAAYYGEIYVEWEKTSENAYLYSYIKKGDFSVKCVFAQSPKKVDYSGDKVLVCF